MNTASYKMHSYGRYDGTNPDACYAQDILSFIYQFAPLLIPGSGPPLPPARLFGTRRA